MQYSGPPAIAPDMIIGSIEAPRENGSARCLRPCPSAFVLTDRPHVVRVSRHGSTELVDPPPAPNRIVGDYGAGDSFAGGLNFFLAHGLSVEEGCRRAGPHGAAVLCGIDPIETQILLVAP